MSDLKQAQWTLGSSGCRTVFAIIVELCCSQQMTECISVNIFNIFESSWMFRRLRYADNCKDRLKWNIFPVFKDIGMGALLALVVF